MRNAQINDQNVDDQDLESLLDDDEILSSYGLRSKRTSKDISVGDARNSTQNRTPLLKKHDELI